MGNSNSKQDSSSSNFNGTLPVLPLPAGSVLLPSSTLAVQLFRQDSLNMLEAVLEEADKKGSTSNAAILAATPFRLPTSPTTATTLKGGASSPPASSPLPLLPSVNANGSTTSGDGVKPSVNQLSECECFSIPCLVLMASSLGIRLSSDRDLSTRIYVSYPAIFRRMW